MIRIYVVLFLFSLGSILGWNEVNAKEDIEIIKPNFLIDDSFNETKILEGDRFRRQIIRRVLKRRKPTEPPPPKKKICLTKGCIRAAYSILESINFNADPCEDFYEYSCGNWIKQRTIPPNLDSYSNFAIAQEELQIALKNVLEETTNSSFKPYEFVRDAYKACMNESFIERFGIQPLIEILQEVVGGWPVQSGNQWSDYSFNWINSLAELSKYNPISMIVYNIIPDPKDSGKHIINLDQLIPVLVRDYYLDDQYYTQRMAYLDYMKSVLKLLNDGRLSYYQESQLREILDFEIQLVKLTSAPENRRDENRKYNKMTLADLQRKYGYWVDFKSFFSRVSPDGLTIEYTDMVKVSEMDYFQNLGYLIRRTPRRVVANYLGWQFIYVAITQMPEEFLRARHTFMKSMTGVSARPERWRFCVDHVNNILPELVGKLYVDSYFPKDSKKEIVSLITNIRKAFREILIKLDWMDLKTKKFAIEKLRAVTAKVGFPNLFLFPKTMEQKYEKLVIYPDRHFTNVINIMKFSRDMELYDLRKPVNKMRWYTKVADTNAFYTWLDNSIIFPAGIIKAPFFDLDRPRVMDYASLGTIIGHELTHGFDDQGRRFDKRGNLVQWWSPTSEKKFKAKSQCFINQYNNYFAPEVNLKLNGVNSQGENVADNAGLRESYMAYKKYQSEFGDGPFLPGINVTHDQLFFLSFAQTWCGISTTETLRNEILADPHSPFKFRVNGVVTNSKEFSEVFSCSNESKMFSKISCKVW